MSGAWSGHTPGPWRYIDATKSAGHRFAPLCIIQAGDRRVAQFSWNDRSPFFPTKAASQANAALIAAAPELAVEVVRLRVALAMMVYQATHLSPERDDGSHICRIDSDVLAAARAALADTPEQPA